MFSTEDMFSVAMQQSAWDLQADCSDFVKDKNVVVPFSLGAKAKSYYSADTSGILISYGSNAVASVKEEYRELIEEYLSRYEFFHCFETPNLHWLNERLEKKGQRVCFMAEYFLPDMERLRALSCPYEIKVLTQEDFAGLYLPQWSNALCEKRKQLDVLGAGAYEGTKLVGLAACSADGQEMWQIGIDVLPEYRRQGIASAITSRLALEIVKRDKVPFYCCAWSNMRSARNAVRSGFKPAWAELSFMPMEKVDAYI